MIILECVSYFSLFFFAKIKVVLEKTTLFISLLFLRDESDFP